MTDAAGSVTDSFQYDEYGKLTDHTGSSETSFLYNGKYGIMTDGSGLIYMRARYYNPEVHRFVSTDILEGDISDPLSLNRYAYCSNDPINSIDPTGHHSSIFLDDGGSQAFLDSLEELNYSYDRYEIEHEPGGILNQIASVDLTPVENACQFLDDAGTALMITDPLPNGSLPPPYGYGLYVDNAAGVLMKGVGKGGKSAISAVTKGGANLAFRGGKAGEQYLAKLVGGRSQVYFRPAGGGFKGGRYVDQLADGIAHESKVGYTSLTQSAKTQILKDAQLIREGQIQGAEWHFFRSAETGKIGASQQLLNFLSQNGINYIIHY